MKKFQIVSEIWIADDHVVMSKIVSQKEIIEEEEEEEDE